jgi:Sulfotransferase domain
MDVGSQSRPDTRSYPARFLPFNPQEGAIIQRRKIERVDFIVAGVQKSGTTALHYFLAKHPHIALPRDQALHFFDQEEHFAGRPDYRILHGNFDPGYRWRIAGEVTADYVYYEPALERIARYNPAMKLIISLRNPTDRAFSHWNMRRAKGREPRDFLDAIRHDLELRSSPALRGNAHIDRGFYAAQIERVFQLFPSKQVLLIKYEDFRRNYSATVDSVLDFLGVRHLRGLRNKERNAGPYQRKITADERAYVSAIFVEDIARLEALLGWDCSDWRGQSGAHRASANSVVAGVSPARA